MTDPEQDSSSDPRPAPPESIHTFATEEEALRPLGPWAFLRPSFRGALRGSALHLLAAWLFFEAATGAAWALHLRSLTRMGPGWSALPQHWGEMLTAKDLWNLAVNGGLADRPFGPFAPALAVAGLAWMFWASWKHQAEEAAVPARLRDWFLGLLDAVFIGILPLLVPYLVFMRLLKACAGTGIQGLGWLSFVGQPLLFLALASAFMTQWWLCRLNRADAAGLGFRAFLAAYPAHLRESFKRLWSHPVQFTALHLGGAALRLGLAFGALLLGWRWGGGSAVRVWMLLLAQLAATAVNAMLLGWMLRLVARYWRRRREVSRILEGLEAARATRPPTALPEVP